jgi:hypothetical protein
MPCSTLDYHATRVRDFESLFCNVPTDSEISPKYFCGGHKLMTMSIVLQDATFRTTCFIIDTGSANSYIRETDRADLKWSHDNNGFIVTGMGKKFTG